MLLALLLPEETASENFKKGPVIKKCSVILFQGTAPHIWPYSTATKLFTNISPVLGLIHVHLQQTHNKTYLAEG